MKKDSIGNDPNASTGIGFFKNNNEILNESYNPNGVYGGLSRRNDNFGANRMSSPAL